MNGQRGSKDPRPKLKFTNCVSLRQVEKPEFKIKKKKKKETLISAKVFLGSCKRNCLLDLLQFTYIPTQI